MNPYINYEVSGLNGIGILSEEHGFNVNDADIECVQLTDEEENIRSIKVLLHSSAIITADVSERITNRIHLFVAELLGRLDTVPQGFSIRISEIYDPNQSAEESDSLEIYSSVCFGANCSATTLNHPIVWYKESFDRVPTDSDKQYTMLLFLNIMKIDNIAIRYLMLYELLKNLIPGDHTQKDVVNFIREQFNPSRIPDYIGFKKTRKIGKNYDEDLITYYRNLLAHNDSSDSPADFEETVLHLCRTLVEAIFYQLNQTP